MSTPASPHCRPPAQGSSAAEAPPQVLHYRVFAAEDGTGGCGAWLLDLRGAGRGDDPPDRALVERLLPSDPGASNRGASNHGGRATTRPAPPQVLAILSPPTAPGEPVSVRFRTAAGELRVCGVATLAAAAHLFAGPDPGGDTSLALSLPAGPTTVERRPDGSLFHTTAPWEELPLTAAPEHPTDRRAWAAGLLGLEADALDPSLPPAAASVGSPKLLVPVRRRAGLEAARPDLPALEAWSRRAGVNGLYAYTLEPREPGSALAVRAFNPLAGVAEDPATGVAAAALVGWLAHSGAPDGRLEAFRAPAAGGSSEPLVVEQGDGMGQPCRLRVAVRADRRMSLGGHVLATEAGVSAP